MDFPGSSVVKNPPAMQETQVKSLGQEDPLEEENGNPLQYSYLKKPTDRGASPKGCKELDMTEQLSTYHNITKRGDRNLEIPDRNLEM